MIRIPSIGKILSVVLAVLAAVVCFARSERGRAAESSELASGPKVVVLNYHKVDRREISLSVSPEDFDRQMTFLKENGYHTITPHEMYMAFTDGAPLPTNPVLITFDDGYADNYINAYPILKKHGMKAAIFVVTDFLDRGVPGYLTWAQAAEMENSGVFSVESHTVTHSSLLDLTDDAIRRELTQSKRDIEQRLGKEVEFLAYPTGAYNLHIASLVKEAGYKGAFTVRFGNMDQFSNFYAMERVPIFREADTFSSFLERIRYVPLFEKIGWAKN